MAKLSVSKPRALIDPDIYDATIVEVKEDHSERFGTKDQYAVKFQIADPDGDFDGQQIRYWVTRFFDGDGPDAEEVLLDDDRANGTKLVKAANPDLDLAAEEDFHIPALLLNRKVRINIVNKANDAGIVRSVVESVLSPTKKKRTAAAA